MLFRTARHQTGGRKTHIHTVHKRFNMLGLDVLSPLGQAIGQGFLTDGRAFKTIINAGLHVSTQLRLHDWTPLLSIDKNLLSCRKQPVFNHSAIAACKQGPGSHNESREVPESISLQS
jgi:hypothetical protein